MMMLTATKLTSCCVKSKRKQAECDLKLLQNRIALLKVSAMLRRELVHGN